MAQTARYRIDGVDGAVAEEFDAIADASALVVYRVVQESLANATRHAPGASIEVSLDQVGDRVEVSVVNEAPVRDVVTLNGPGSGIPGMVERVRAVGGNLIAVPRTAGGFQVTAVLPARAPSTQVTEVEVASVRGPL